MLQTRNTKQKSILNDSMRRFKEFFTAEDLFNKARIKDKRISLATTYRFLKEQCKKENLHSFSCDKKTLYSLENTSHAHYQCQRCHKVIHFPLQNLNFLKQKPPGNICHFQLEITGVCDSCQKSQEK